MHVYFSLTLCMGCRLALVLVQICLILGVHLNKQPLLYFLPEGQRAMEKPRDSSLNLYQDVA